ncbi:MAG: cyclic nucleotide-binding domain-containing protein [Verrucomicrobiae bacterium]|nr:cyclic nucleotide-binding domain-containing protein [Verrucomicrobiae bacterium]
MSADSSNAEYKVWAADDVVYGPVPLDTLVQWVRDERVLRGTWIHAVAANQWIKAEDLRELSDAFAGRAGAAAPAEGPEPTLLISGLRPGMLRRVKALSTMNDQQLGRFVQLMEVVRSEAYKLIVKQGSPGDAMYAVLDGEVRARMMVGGKETELARFGPGDIFGEMSLFDGGPRSADVVANSTSTLLRITAERFERLCREQPELANPLLFELAKSLAKRIRADDKKIADVYRLARVGGLD